MRVYFLKDRLHIIIMFQVMIWELILYHHLKSYVRGFEVETISPTSLDFQKPRAAEAFGDRRINYFYRRRPNIHIP
jgi:hypothetical protein